MGRGRRHGGWRRGLKEMSKDMQTQTSGIGGEGWTLVINRGNGLLEQQFGRAGG
jgi:hypothetical protein